MTPRHVLIAGGAGFVGSSLARMLARHGADLRITALDNLKRRGSELNLPLLATDGVRFVHGDIRVPEDLDAAGDVDLLIDCAAEPAATAGLDDRSEYVLQTNLMGTVNCLEHARKRGAALLLLSTSRVYPIETINDLPYVETATRFTWDVSKLRPGLSERGISEEFPLAGARSLYGASKLASELILHEYVHGHGLRALVDRCGVIAGPGQLGKVDQGVVTHWIACHYFQRPLAYLGWGGTGKQVRDVLHVRDLFDLVQRQIETPNAWDGSVYNVGGGASRSLSLKELTRLCAEISGRELEIGSHAKANRVDIRIFVSDCARVERAFDWQPSASIESIVADTHAWIDANAKRLRPVLAP